MDSLMDREWVTEAACRGADVAVFHPTKGHRMHETQALAKEYCESCTVRQPCLEYAVKGLIEVGVWGGLSAKQRRPYRVRYLKGEWP